MMQKTSVDLPFVHDLSPKDLLELQKAAAQDYRLDISFRDALRSGGQGPELAVIPAGRFLIGAAPQEYAAHPTEYPQHYQKVEKPFALGRYLLTADEFARFQKATGFAFSQELLTTTGDEPVINLRFHEVQDYLAWLSAETGQRYRLPTEVEWEYAARAGTTTPYYFGETVTCKEVHANPRRELNDGSRITGPTCLRYPRAIPVGCFAYNLWGLYDMHGNVWEFTQSPWRQTYTDLLPENRPLSEQSPWVVVRGGSWFEPLTRARSAARSKRLWDELDVNLGFRVLRELSS
jgi:formylglycine-generating enzyme required for sulfatase activity